MKIFSLIITIGLFLFISCKKEKSCESCTSNQKKPPVAIAGTDQAITLPANSVSLDGSGSTDADGIINSFQWSKIEGPVTFNIKSALSSITIVENLAIGVYKFELKITDNDGLSAKDTVQITVVDASQSNRPPIANAGLDQTISLPNNFTTLNGSNSTDPDNNITGYIWTKISGPSVFIINNPNIAQTQVSNLTDGTYQFELKVTDAGGLFDRDTVQVLVNMSLCEQVFPSSSCTGYWVCVSHSNLNSISYTSRPNVGAFGASASLGNKIYFAGGHDDSYYIPGASWGSLAAGFEYDVQQNCHRTFELSLPRSHIAGATAGDKILFAGGDDLSFTTNNTLYYNNVDVYDQSTLARQTTQLSEARSYLAAVSTATKAYFMGGKIQSGFSNKMDIYNVTTNSWSVINLPRERGFAGAAIIGDYIYLAGGRNNSGNINIVDIYNIQSGTWSTLQVPHDHPNASVVAVNNKLIVAGGDGLNNKSVDIFNTITNQWTSVNLTDSRFNMAIATANNKVVFLGGMFTIVPISYSTSVDVYDDNLLVWQSGSISPGITGAMGVSSLTKIMFTGFLFDGSIIPGAVGPAIPSTMIVINP